MDLTKLNSLIPETLDSCAAVKMKLFKCTPCRNKDFAPCLHIILGT